MTGARAARRVGALVVALALMATVACATISSFPRTTRLLEETGYTEISLEIAGGSGLEDVVEVTYQGVDDHIEPDRAKEAARIVWRELDVGFDVVVFYVFGSARYANGELQWSRPQLSGFFGPRPSRLRDQRGEDEFTGAAKTVGLTIAVLFGVVVLGGVALAVGLSRRRSARRAAGVYANNPWSPDAYAPGNPWAPTPYADGGRWSGYPAPVQDAPYVPPADPTDPWAPPPR